MPEEERWGGGGGGGLGEYCYMLCTCVPGDGLAHHPGGVVILLVASRSVACDELVSHPVVIL